MNKFVQVSIDCYIVCTGETGGMTYRRFESVTSVTHILQEFCLYGGYSVNGQHVGLWNRKCEFKSHLSPKITILGIVQILLL